MPNVSSSQMRDLPAKYSNDIHFETVYAPRKRSYDAYKDRKKQPPVTNMEKK